MLRVGLTGGLATGKSFVGSILASLGCHLLKADVLGHEVLLPDGEAYAPVVEAFGRGILDEQGRINRRALASQVFSDQEKLKLLNSIVHPAVQAREEIWFSALRERDPAAIAVVEAAILIETGSYRRFDRLIVTFCRPEQQIERAMARDGMSREQVEARIRQQMPIEQKRLLADFIIDTSGPKEETEQQVKNVYSALRSEVR